MKAGRDPSTHPCGDGDKHSEHSAENESQYIIDGPIKANEVSGAGLELLTELDM